jgi:hypothetical protein
MPSEIADFYEDDSAIQSPTSIIEPILMIVVGVSAVGRCDPWTAMGSNPGSERQLECSDAFMLGEGYEGLGPRARFARALPSEMSSR